MHYDHVRTLLLEDFHDPVIILRFMGESTVGAYLDLLPVLFLVVRSTGAFFQSIHGAITEQTVKVPFFIMTGKIFTVSVFKKSMRILHVDPSCLSACRCYHAGMFVYDFR